MVHITSTITTILEVGAWPHHHTFMPVLVMLHSNSSSSIVTLLLTHIERVSIQLVKIYLILPWFELHFYIVYTNFHQVTKNPTEG